MNRCNRISQVCNDKIFVRTTLCKYVEVIYLTKGEKSIHSPLRLFCPTNGKPIIFPSNTNTRMRKRRLKTFPNWVEYKVICKKSFCLYRWHYDWDLFLRRDAKFVKWTEEIHCSQSFFFLHNKVSNLMTSIVNNNNWSLNFIHFPYKSVCRYNSSTTSTYT